jgi:quercetin dioxygenase-like cupin family protein
MKGKERKNPMKYQYLIDLNDPKNWLWPDSAKDPDGRVMETQHMINQAEGVHRFFLMTDSIMHKSVDENFHYHEHGEGYETFFVDEGVVDFIYNDMRVKVGAGNIVFCQPYQGHGMFVREDTKYRGFFHDIGNGEDQAEVALLRSKNPDYKLAEGLPPELNGPPLSNFFLREPPVGLREVPVEQCSVIRNIARPIISYEFPGATLKLITGRWEHGGLCEMWGGELKKGFKAHWDEFPLRQEMYYVTKGEIKFTVYDEEFVATPECVVKIPKYAVHTLEALTDAVIYDVDGQTRWLDFLQDRASIQQNDPARFSDEDEYRALRKKYGCLVKKIEYAE